MSLDENNTNPPSEKADHRTAWLATAIFIVLILLGAVGGFALDKWRDSRAANSATSDAKITSVGGMAVKDGEVTVGKDGGATWVSSYFTDGSGVPENETVSDSIAQGLTDIANLRTWRLCKAELLAQSKTLAGWAKAKRDFPRNKPENNDPAESAADAVRLDAQAKLYADAAALAGANNLPCTPEGASTRMPAVIFTVQHEGHARQLAVTDYAVVSVMPLEFHLLTKNTVTKERASRKLSEERKVDTEQVMYYHTEQAQASSLTTHDAVIEMLAADPTTRN
jgi:hypothetical protein